MQSHCTAIQPMGECLPARARVIWHLAAGRLVKDRRRVTLSERIREPADPISHQAANAAAQNTVFACWHQYLVIAAVPT